MDHALDRVSGLVNLRGGLAALAGQIFWVSSATAHFLSLGVILPKIRFVSSRRPGVARWSTVVCLLIAAALAIRLLGPQTVGETVRRQICAKLREIYPDLRVTIRRGNFDPHRGMVLEGITFSVPGGVLGRSGPVIAHIDELVASGSMHGDRLKEGKNPFATNRLRVRGLEINVWPTEGDTFSAEQLLPLPKFGELTPRTDFQDIRVRLYQGPPQNSARPIEVVCQSATMVQKETPEGTARRITATGASEFAEKWMVQANLLGDEDPTIRLRAKANLVSIDPELLRRLPKPLAKQCEVVSSVRCVANFEASLSKISGDPKIDYLVSTTVIDGVVSHPKLPLPIDSIAGQFDLSPRQLVIRHASAGVGGSSVRLSGKIEEPITDPTADIRLAVSDFRIDRSLVAKLPADLRASWALLQIQGALNVNLHWRHRLLAPPGTPMELSGELICKGIEANFHRFPFPVTQIVGPISFGDGRIQCQSLRGQFGGQTMVCGFDVPMSPKLVGPEKSKKKWFEASVDGPIAINDTLIAALTPRGETSSGLATFAGQLAPRGSMHVNVARFGNDEYGVPHRRLDLRIVGGHVRYKHFPYPIYNVSGAILTADQEVKISDFSGNNAGGGMVRCNGSMHLATPPATDLSASAALNLDPPDQNDLRLAFNVDDLAMDGRLRAALPTGSQRVWDSIAPAGVLDHVDLELRLVGEQPLAMNVTARQRPREMVTGETLSLRPASLPYRLDLTSGVVHYDGSKVRIENITGVNDGSRLAASGGCYAREDGRWVLAMDVLGGSRLVPDAKLIGSLPESMRGAMRSLQLRGPVNIRGRSELVLPDENYDEPIVNWDLILALEGNRIADGNQVHAIRGEIEVRGRRDAEILRADGMVRIDSMHVYDQQIVGIEGPFQIVDETLTLGSRTREGYEDQVVHGKLFDGDFGLDGTLQLGSGDFDIAMSLREASLVSLLLDFGYQAEDLTGALSGTVHLEGNLGTIELLKGDGTARVNGANLYELPLLIQIFNQLRISPSPKNAFTDAQMEFSLFADHVTMRELQIWGDLVSLFGGGTLNRRRELDLTFNTRVSPQNIVTRTIRPLRDSRYTLWTVDVTGPLTDPKIERRAFDRFLLPPENSSERQADSGEQSGGLFGKWRR